MDALTGMSDLQRTQLQAAWSAGRGRETGRKFDQLLRQAAELADGEHRGSAAAASTGAGEAQRAGPAPNQAQNGRVPDGAAKRNDAGSAAEDRKLMDVCRDMEALFIGQMLDAMRKTVHEGDLFGKSMAKDIFRDMLYDEYAKLMARTDQLGLARQMYNQIRD